MLLRSQQNIFKGDMYVLSLNIIISFLALERVTNENDLYEIAKYQNYTENRRPKIHPIH